MSEGLIQFDSDAASRTESDNIRIAGRIESIIGDRESETKFVKENREDNNSGDAYSSVEKDWLDAAGGTLQLVHKRASCWAKTPCPPRMPAARSRASGDDL